jgi:hypothetical protein
VSCYKIARKEMLETNMSDRVRSLGLFIKPTMTGAMREQVPSPQRSGSDKTRGRKFEYCTDSLKMEIPR